MDNLESQTYETFEKDPIKYAQYQEVCLRIWLYSQPVLSFTPWCLSKDSLTLATQPCSQVFLVRTSAHL